MALGGKKLGRIGIYCHWPSLTSRLWTHMAEGPHVELQLLNGSHLRGTQFELLVGFLCFLSWAVLHDVLIGGELVPHEIDVEAEQVAKKGCGEEAQKDEEGSQGQDGRSLGLHRGSRQEHKPNICVILQDFKVLICAKSHGVDKELHEDVSGHQHQEQDTQ